MKETIPDYIQKLFWDVKRDKVEINRHASFIIRRVLDFGNVKALNWLRNTYPPSRIREVIQKKRGLAPKTLTFWTEYFKIN
ncbi:MAG: hypothetical protein ABIK97_04340 [candidate division WOR-3 bacterium]